MHQTGPFKAPRAVAEAILKELPPNELVASTSMAGPGFINIRISPQWLGKHVQTMLVEVRTQKGWLVAFG